MGHKLFAVTTPATDRTLLTIAELRLAAGVEGNARDAELTRLGNSITASIVKVCRVVTDGATPPTLRLETVSDTFRSISYQNSSRYAYIAGRHRHLMLSRKPVVEIISITENDVVLDPATDFLVNKSAGMLTRLSNDREICWPSGTIIGAYSAGWVTVPDDLKYAASTFVQLSLQQTGRDPFLTLKRTEGVSEYRWNESSKDSVVPYQVMDILETGGYINEWVG